MATKIILDVDTGTDDAVALMTAVLHPEIEGFTVTAGNAAGLNDAAAAVMLTDAEYLRAIGEVAHDHGALFRKYKKVWLPRVSWRTVTG